MTLYKDTSATCEDRAQDLLSHMTLEEKIVPHQANLAQDYTKIQQLYMDEKRVEALQKWVERAKENTTVTIIPDYQCCDLFIK